MMLHDTPTAASGSDTRSPTPPATPQQGSSPLAPPGKTWLSRLGLPEVRWSLSLLGLCLYTFVMVTYYLQIAEIGIGIAALGLVLQKQKLRYPFPVWIFGAFIAWAFVASYASPFMNMAVDRVLDYLKLLAIMFIAVNTLRTEGQLRFYLLFFLACFVLFPVRGTLVGGDTLQGRAVWNYIYANPNDLASLCLISLGVALGFLFATPSRPIVRFGGGLNAVLLLVIILMTQSRGAFIGLVVGLGPALAAAGFKRPGRLFVVAVFLAVVIAIAVPSGVWVRLIGIQKLASASTITEADAEGSAEERLEIQKVALRISLDHPIFGIGLGAYPLANARYAYYLGQRDTHNTYLNLAAEVGLPGFLLWCALAWSVLRKAYRSRRRAIPGPLATQQAWIERALWAFLVAGLFGTYAKLNLTYLLLAVLWCSANLLDTESATRATRDESH